MWSSISLCKLDMNSMTAYGGRGSRLSRTLKLMQTQRCPEVQRRKWASPEIPPPGFQPWSLKLLAPRHPDRRVIKIAWLFFFLFFPQPVCTPSLVIKALSIMADTNTASQSSANASAAARAKRFPPLGWRSLSNGSQMKAK